MSIARRLYLAFFVVTALMTGIGLLGLRTMRELNLTTERLAIERFGKVQLAERGVAAINDNSRRALRLFLIEDPSEFDAVLKEQIETSAAITQTYAEFEARLDSQEEHELFNAVRAARSRYVTRRADAERILRGGDRAQAHVVFEREVLPELTDYIEAWNKVLELEGRRMDDAAAQAAESYASTRILTIALLCGAVVLAAGAGIYVTRSVSRPILEVANAAWRLQHGEVDARVTVRSEDEVGTLARAFNLMGEAVAFRQERLQREMDLAQHIQTALLPRKYDVASYEIAAEMRPATQVGGDYYDVLPVAGGFWAGVGDVSGHGVDAGLVMLMIQSSVATLISRDPDTAPKDALNTLNRVIFANVHERLRGNDHATLVLLRFRDDGTVIYAGAHEDFIVCRKATGACEVQETPGTWIGGMPDIERATRDSSLQLEVGDVVVLYTDGLIEARNADGERFGLDRLKDELAKCQGEPVDAIRDAVLLAVTTWTAWADDDVSVVVTRYRGTAS